MRTTYPISEIKYIYYMQNTYLFIKNRGRGPFLLSSVLFLSLSLSYPSLAVLPASTTDIVSYPYPLSYKNNYKNNIHNDYDKVEDK